MGCENASGPAAMSPLCNVVACCEVSATKALALLVEAAQTDVAAAMAMAAVSSLRRKWLGILNSLSFEAKRSRWGRIDLMSERRGQTRRHGFSWIAQRSHVLPAARPLPDLSVGVHMQVFFLYRQ